MYRIVGLTKVAGTEPQQYMLMYKDLENKHHSYSFSTAHGTEDELRELLKSGMTDVEINALFIRAV